MRLARTIGTVTLSRVHPSLVGARWRLVVPLSRRALAAAADAESSGSASRASDREALVAMDERSSGLGQVVALTEGAEAAAPFYPDSKPIDAYLAALLDSVELLADASPAEAAGS